MKKAIIFPVLGVLAITLWSFTPAPQATQILTGTRGEAIIPTTCNISADDQNFLVNTIQAYGPDYGYLAYTSADGSVQHFGNYFGEPVNPQALQWTDAQNPGSDLSHQNAFCGVVIVEANQAGLFPGDTKFVIKQGDLSTVYNKLEPVLQKYGYQAPQ